MDNLTANNPNLDGDFKALIEAQKTWKTDEDDDDDNEEFDRRMSHIQVGIQNDQAQAIANNNEPEYDDIREKLFEAAEQDNVASLETSLRELHKNGKSLGNSEMRDPQSGKNVLHHAVNCKSYKVASLLIDKMKHKEEFLTASYIVTVAKVDTLITTLYKLTKQNNITLIRKLLPYIKDSKDRVHFMEKTVMTEMEGQRPRHLSCIHLAALNGNTELVNLFVELGISVNFKNNKNDTPILWAARGNHKNTVIRLLELGANPNDENDKGSTPLYWCVRYGFTELCEILLSRSSANVNQRRKLGLVSPIVLAAAMGNNDILKILLKHKANPSTQITSGRTPLHFAAMYGHRKIIYTLLDEHVDIDVDDDLGDTPLMYAAKHGKINAIRTLLENHADMTRKNKLDQGLWDYAIAQDDKLIVAIVDIYRKSKRVKGKLNFPNTRSPLHAAAANGSVDKLKLVISLEVDPNIVDKNENTFYHQAARENKVTVLKEFIDVVDVDAKNCDGETAVHIACRKGHLEAVNVLVKKAKLNVFNNEGETPLHVAARSEGCPADVVEKLVELVVKTQNWSLVDAVDRRGNTALHYACRAGRMEILEALYPLNPSITNAHGSSPLHLVAKSGRVQLIEEFLEVFNTIEKGLNINQRNGEGETALHICAKLGEAACVTTLIKEGADLSIRDDTGNTVLHDLADGSLMKQATEEALLEVFKAIVNSATWWWCITRDIHIPDDDSEFYTVYKTQALRYLFTKLANNEGYNVIQYSAKTGFSDMLQEICNIKGVFKITDVDTYLFDITEIVQMQKVKPKRSSVDVMKSRVSIHPTVDDYPVSEHSCLEIIARLDDEVQATLMLDVAPISFIAKRLWTQFQWIYGLLMIIHITYMSCLTAYTIPWMSVSVNLNASDPSTEVQVASVYPGLFLLWPCIMLLVSFYFIGDGIRRFCNGHTTIYQKEYNTTSKVLCGRFNSILDIPYFLTYTFLENIAIISVFLFSIFLILWLIFYYENNPIQVYFLTVALIIGWIFTITFTKGFETVHAFSIMLKYIILRDITRFLFVYSFLLLGFGAGIYALFQLTASTRESFPSFIFTLFTTFNMMIGMAEIFEDDTFQNYNDVGSSAGWLVAVYIIYIIFSTIIMLNLLIAMMSDTYNEVKSREGLTWRISSVQMALRLESALPFLPKMLRAIGLFRSPIETRQDGRLFYRINKSEFLKQINTDDEDMTKLMRHLDAKVNQITDANTDIRDRMEFLKDRYHHLEDTVMSISQSMGLDPGAGGDTPRRRSLVRRPTSSLKPKKSL